MPQLATAAIFVAIMVLDLTHLEAKAAVGHALFGILCTLLMGVLCQNNAYLAAWGLLALPFIILAIGYIIAATKKMRTAAIAAANTAAPANIAAVAAPYQPGCYDYYL